MQHAHLIPFLRLYTSSRNGYQSYSEKYVHARESAAEGVGLGNVSKKVQKCKPSVEHIECHAEVVKEVKRRVTDSPLLSPKLFFFSKKVNPHEKITLKNTEDIECLRQVGRRSTDSHNPYQRTTIHQ